VDIFKQIVMHNSRVPAVIIQLYMHARVRTTTSANVTESSSDQPTAHQLKSAAFARIKGRKLALLCFPTVYTRNPRRGK